MNFKINFLKVLTTLIVILVIFGGYFWYIKNSNAKASINQEGLDAQKSEKSKKIELENIEIADTAQERARGMMYRSDLCEKCGMLFIFQYPEVLSFWMRNTYISLDIIFLDEKGKVLKINPNTIPKNDNIFYDSSFPATYALEFNAGFSKKIDLKEGDFIDLEELTRNSTEYQFIQ